MRSYRIVAGEGILKVLHDDRIILEEKKRMRGHYYLMENPVRGGASAARRSPVQGGVSVEVDQTLDGRLERTRGDVTK